MSTRYFQGRTLLITGASSGIGKALAQGLFADSKKLILVARNQVALENLRDELQGSEKIQICALDIRDENAVAMLAQQIDLDSVDILINNAGIVRCARFEDLASEDFTDTLETNFLGQVWMTRLLLPSMKSRGQGQIVNIASMAGVMGLAGYTAYGASKHALVGFNEALRNELSGTGIDLTLVLPSDVDTPQFEQEQQTKPEATRALSGKLKPLSAEQAARQILKAISAKKSQISISPFEGRLLLFLYQRFPGISRRIMDAITRPHNRC